jgi:hypothetical protein
MRQLTITFTIFILASTVLFAQDFETKGVKIEDYNLTSVKYNLSHLIGFGGKTQTRIRKVTIGTSVEYFYQIKIGDNNTRPLLASLTGDELIEARAALEILLEKSRADAASKANEIQNSYKFESGFSIGYLIADKRVSWFFSQENAIEEETIFLEDIKAIVKTFGEATIIIEQLKNE